jgi:hypothetical protein
MAVWAALANAVVILPLPGSDPGASAPSGVCTLGERLRP